MGFVFDINPIGLDTEHDDLVSKVAIYKSSINTLTEATVNATTEEDRSIELLTYEVTKFEAELAYYNSVVSYLKRAIELYFTDVTFDQAFCFILIPTVENQVLDVVFIYV